MRTVRIELEGDAGHVAIERPRNSDNIRIDSIVRDPLPGEQAWKTWEVEARATSDDGLFDIATEPVRRRTQKTMATQATSDTSVRS